MNRHIPHLVFATAMGLALWAGGSACAQEETLDTQPEFPKIVRQPEDQAIWQGSNVTFSVTSDNAEGFLWMRNGVVLEGETNGTLTLENVAANDVGLYTCFAVKGEEAVPTRSATLNVLAGLGGGGGPIVVFGAPQPGNGGQGSTCPGPYVGYVSFLKSAAQGWGWVPTLGAASHTATDTNRTDTHIVYTGRLGDHDCDLTTVDVSPIISLKYRFTVYFPDNLPTNNYAIVLDGFDP